MLRFDSQFLKWLMIGAVVAVIADVLLYPLQLLINSQTEAGALPAAAGLVIQCLLGVILTVIALVAIGERGVSSIVVASVATVVAFLIEQSTHLAALSIGVSVATFGDRRHSVRTPVRPAAGGASAPSRSPVGTVETRSVNRRRRRRRR